MNQGPSGINEGAASILRALGSLMTALAGGDSGVAQRIGASLPDLAQPAPPHEASPSRPADTSYRYAPPPASVRPPETARAEQPQRPASAQAPSGDPDDVEFVLADARERAQRIIDESIERARELIDRRRPAPAVDPEILTGMRQSIRDLLVEVRDLQQRIARIETMLREDREARTLAAGTAPQPVYETPAYYAPEPEPAPAPAAEPPSYAAPSYPTPTPAELDPAHIPDPLAQPLPPPTFEVPSVYEPPSIYEPVEPLAAEPATYEPAAAPVEPEPEQATSAAAAIPSPAPAPPRSTFSVVPPQRRDWEPDAAEPADGIEAPAPPPSAVPRLRFGAASMPAPDPAWADPEPDPTDAAAGAAAVPGEAPIATFLPDDGSIALRVSPVSGFQGLMRVQDALARLPAVRHASVEAYSQGEARLRIELSEPTDSEEMASGLSRSLKEPAHVQHASEADRELLIALR